MMHKIAVFNFALIMAFFTAACGIRETYFEYKIVNFFEYDRIDSPQFSIGNGQFSIRIFPNAEGPDARGNVSMYIVLNGTEGEHPVDFTMGLKKPDGSEIVSRKITHTFTFENRSIGYRQIIKRSALQTVVPGGTLIAFCKARIMNSVKDIPEFTFSNGTGHLSENLKDLYASKRYSDVKLNVKSKEFSAHKNILSSRVTAFASMNIPNRVEIKDVDSDSFEEFLLFIYTGKLVKVSMQKAMSVYRTAKKYKLSELMEKCARSIAEQDLNMRNLYDILDFANLHNDNVLLTALAEYLIKNGKYIFSTEKWETFLVDNPLQVNKLLLRYVEKKQYDSAGN